MNLPMGRFLEFPIRLHSYTLRINMYNSLKHFRHKQGVSQLFIANKLGINRATYMNYELGRRRPPQSFYYQLAHIFRLPVEDVLPISQYEQTQS
jgi:DNA-binding XRE family transcriptional regulator